MRDDRIIHGSDTAKESDYLATPEVRLTGKKEVIVDEDGGRSAYSFQLNTAPDAVWCGCLADIIDHPPEGIHRSDLRVEVTGDTLTLLCMPSKLETKYAFVKAAVAEANERYHAERETVRRRVAGFDAEKQEQANAEKTKTENIRERFDRLEL